MATHLVTTRHAEFRTESNNLNLIFSGFEEYDSQLNYFYDFVPYILLYTTEIVYQYLLQKKSISLKDLLSLSAKKIATLLVSDR